MDVLIVLVFVSLVLVGGGVLLFLVGVHQGDFEHADRLALLPLLDSSVTRGTGPPDAEDRNSRSSELRPDAPTPGVAESLELPPSTIQPSSS